MGFGQFLFALLLLLVHSIVLLAAGFGLAHLYFASSMDRGRLILNQALHVHQHNYSGSLWFLHRSVAMPHYALELAQACFPKQCARHIDSDGH